MHVFAQVVTGDVCASGKFTSVGECCSLCPVGTGVVSNCEQEDTKCQLCKEGECSRYNSIGIYLLVSIIDRSICLSVYLSLIDLE